MKNHDEQAERAVLCAVLLDNARMAQARAVLGAQSFFFPAHREIFSAMEALDGKKPIDPLTLSAELERRGTIKHIEGGMDYLVGLLDASVSGSNISAHSRIVLELATLRKLISACAEIIGKAQADYGELGEFLEESEKKIFELSHKLRRSDIEEFSAILHRSITAIVNLRSGKVRGISTKFNQLDRYLGGFRDGDLYLLAGRPAMGKSALAKDFVVNAARTGIPSLVFSLEMPNEQWVDRVLASESGIDLTNIRRGEFHGDEEWARLQAIARSIQGWPLTFDETPTPSVSDVRGKARRWAAEKTKGKGLLVVDYLQLMRGTNPRDSREQQVSEISRGLKALAKELRIPVIALAQLNRELERRDDKRPMLSDLRESGALEQDADVILFVYRDEKYHPMTAEKGTAEVIIAKQRNGPTGTAKLKFEGRHTRFANMPSEAGQHWSDV